MRGVQHPQSGSRGHADSATVRAARRLTIQATASLWPPRSASPVTTAARATPGGEAVRFIVVDPRVAVDQWCPSATDQPRRENQPRNWCGRDVRGQRHPCPRPQPTHAAPPIPKTRPGGHPPRGWRSVLGPVAHRPRYGAGGTRAPNGGCAISRESGSLPRRAAIKCTFIG